MKTMLLTLILLGSAACAPAPAPVAPAPTPAAATAIPGALHWTRTAAEHRAAFLQTYRAADDQLRELVRSRPAGSWAVVIDADETILDNSEYQRRIAQRGERYAIDTWNAWIREVAADSLPGASGFIRTVRQLGGRVVVITGREEVVCEPTRENLRRLQIAVDAVLCQQPDERGKEDRFRAVAAGTTAVGLPALDVVMFIGDNIQDFPGGTQQLRGASVDALERFGRTWFILPNPMYGSWERNAAR